MAPRARARASASEQKPAARAWWPAALAACVLAAGVAFFVQPQLRASRASGDGDIDVDEVHSYGSQAPIQYDRRLDSLFAHGVVDFCIEELARTRSLDPQSVRVEVDAVIDAEWPNATAALPSIARDVQNRHYFDLATYAVFRVAARHIPAEGQERLAFTERIGWRILGMAEQSASLSPKATLSEDEEPWEAPLEALIGYLSRVGYLAEGGIDWLQWNQARWRQRGKGRFRYWMKDPVILPSAKRLYSEYGFAQHFSSRTLEALFERFGILAREDDSFDPRGFPPELVVEQWELRLIDPPERPPSGTERYIESARQRLQAGLEAAAAAEAEAASTGPPLPLGAPPA